MVQVVYDVHPVTSAITMVLLFLLAVTVALHYFLSTLNPRVLKGQEMSSAEVAYKAIRQADLMADHPGPVFDTLTSTADMTVTTFDRNSNTDEAKRASKVFHYYMESVKELPRQDLRCIVLLQSAVRKADPFVPQPDLSPEELTDSTRAYYRCLSQRQSVERNVRACRNESRSYVELGNPPPVDTCVFNYETPLIDRR